LAQLGPEAPMLAKQTLSPIGLDIPEAAVPSPISANPAGIVGMADWGITEATEFDYGWIRFQDGPDVRSDIQTMLGIDQSGGYWRVMRYGFNSNTSEAARVLPAGTMAKLSGEAFMVSYARQSGPVRWGVSLNPRDTAKTQVFVPDGFGGLVEVANGEAYSTFSGRLGLQTPLLPKLNYGLLYTYEHDKTDLLLSPLITGLPEPIVLSGGYLSKLATVGLAWQPSSATTTFLDYQCGTIRGDNLDTSVNLWYVGVEQFLSPQFSIKITNLDGAWGYTAGYYQGTKLNAGVSFSPGSFRRTQEYLGKADTTYIWIAGSW